MKLVSIIMPTRSGSHESLRKAVRSILDAPGTNKDNVEILLRLDDDDAGRLPVAQELVNGNGAIVVGPRGTGYNNMGGFVDDLVKLADSRFCWLFDDDAFVEGNWYGPLSGMPDACGVNSQHYYLGKSRYENGPRGGPVGIIVPTELAKSIPSPFPVDQVWMEVVLQRGWTIRQMQGVDYHHDGRAR